MVPTAIRRIHQVLVAVDLTAASDRLVRRTTLLPLAADARWEILHVVPSGLSRKAQSATERMAQDRLRRLQRVAGTAPGNLALPALETIVGLPYVEIIRRSRAIGADLVVVGGARTILGSTPKRVIRKGDVPVLVVIADPMRPYRRPIVAVDLSDTSRRVVDLARRILGPGGSNGLSLVHAYHAPFEQWLREEGLGREFKEAAASELRRLHQSFGREARGWRPVLRKGDPRVAILEEVERRRADLIVLGTHGRSGVSHALLGSVAEWVTSAAPCDVAITRPTRYSFELP